MKAKQMFFTPYKILPIALLIAFGSMSVHADVAIGDKTPENFALPFGLEGIQDVNAQAIPNLVFVIDDSKRTGELLPNGQTKLEAYKKAVESFIRANKGKYRFGIAGLYDIEGEPSQVANVMKLAKSNGVMISSAPAPDDAIALEKLNALKVQDYEKAPIIASLTQVYKEMGEKAIIYRCQQSYVFVISDGDSTGDTDNTYLTLSPTGSNVIFPEIAAFTKMKGKFDPYIPHLKSNERMAWFLDDKNEFYTKEYKAGDLLPHTLLSKGYGYIQSCTIGGVVKDYYNSFEKTGTNLCYVQPSPDGYSTYAHFADEDKYWSEKRGKSHYFDDPEYPVQSIYTSWFSSRKTDQPSPDKIVVEKNNFNAQLLISPEKMALRGRGYYRFISSQDDLGRSLSEVSQKFNSNPALAMGRYYAPDVLLAGYRRPVAISSDWKEEEKVTYLEYKESLLLPKERMKKMPILRVANYPNRWASAYVYSQLDEEGTGKTEKYPEKINEKFKYNDSFAGRDVEMQMLPFSMVHGMMSPHIINTTRGVKVIADSSDYGSGRFAGFNDITDLTNEEFGIESNDVDRLKKTWPFYFTLGEGPNYQLFSRFGYPGISSSQVEALIMLLVNL